MSALPRHVLPCLWVCMLWKRVLDMSWGLLISLVVSYDWFALVFTTASVLMSGIQNVYPYSVRDKFQYLSLVLVFHWGPYQVVSDGFPWDTLQFVLWAQARTCGLGCEWGFSGRRIGGYGRVAHSVLLEVGLIWEDTSTLYCPKAEVLMRMFVDETDGQGYNLNRCQVGVLLP